MIISEDKSFPEGALVRHLYDPELGPGRFLGWDDANRLNVLFEWTGELRRLNAQDVPLERYLLFGQVPVLFQSDKKTQPAVVIERIGDPGDGDELLRYRIQSGKDILEVLENELSPLPAQGKRPVDTLRALEWQSPGRFFGRCQIRRAMALAFEDSSGLPTLLGSRVRLSGRRLLAPCQILRSTADRFLVAQPRGGDRRATAGLVLQALFSEQPDLTALVVTPGSKCRNWVGDLYLRFGGRPFFEIDLGRVAGLEPDELEELLEQPRLVVSAAALSRREVSRALADRDWGALVLDGAHLYPAASPLRKAVDKIVKRSGQVVALSPLPFRGCLPGLAEALSLTTGKKRSVAALKKRVKQREPVWSLLAKTLRGVFPLAEEEEGEKAEQDEVSLAEEWRKTVGDDPQLTPLLDELAAGRSGAALRLAGWIQETRPLDPALVTLPPRASDLRTPSQVLEYEADAAERDWLQHLESLTEKDDPSPLRTLYRSMATALPEAVADLFKTRTKIIKDGPKKAAQWDLAGWPSLDSCEADRSAIARLLVSESGVLAGEGAWLRKARKLLKAWQETGPSARLRAAAEWIEGRLKDEIQTIAVWVDDPSSADMLAAGLGALLTKRVVVERIRRNEDPSAGPAQVTSKKVIVASDPGLLRRGDFDAALHFDLPPSPFRMERRLRRNQEETENVVLLGPSPWERSLWEMCRRLQLDQRSPGRREWFSGHFAPEWDDAARQGVDELDRVSEKWRSAFETDDSDVAFDAALVPSAPRLQVAEDLYEILKSPAEWSREEKAFIRWARSLGLNAGRRRDGSWDIQWSALELTREVPQLMAAVGEDGRRFLSGTFDRARALRWESLQFLAPGHPFFEALCRDVEDSDRGRVSVMGMQLGPRYAGRIFLVVLGLGRCQFSDDLPIGLIRRARGFLWPEVVAEVVELSPGADPAAALCDDDDLRSILTVSSPQQRYSKVAVNLLGQGLDLPLLWDAVEQGIPLCLQAMADERREIVSEAAQEWDEDCSAELVRLGCEVESASKDEAPSLEELIEAHRRTRQALLKESIGLEAVAIVLGAHDD